MSDPKLAPQPPTATFPFAALLRAPTAEQTKRVQQRCGVDLGRARAMLLRHVRPSMTAEQLSDAALGFAAGLLVPRFELAEGLAAELLGEVRS